MTKQNRIHGPTAPIAPTALARLASSAALVALAGAAQAQQPPDGIPMMSMDNVAYHGFLYAGGEYVEYGNDVTMGGAMYVEVMVPHEIQQDYPIVFLHGAGQTGVDYLQTPDGRPGWAYDFIDMGYVVYVQDFPARGRSQYVPEVDGNINIRNGPQLEQIFTASAATADFPQAEKHTQFPGTGLMGDPVADYFMKTQVEFIGGRQAQLTIDANVALLDMIGTPVILLTHSQGGWFGWNIADERPGPGARHRHAGARGAADPRRGYDQRHLPRVRWPGLGRRQHADHLRYRRSAIRPSLRSSYSPSPKAPTWCPATGRSSRRGNWST